MVYDGIFLVFFGSFFFIYSFVSPASGLYIIIVIHVHGFDI